MIDDYKRFPLKTNDKYFFKEAVQTKPSNTKSTLASNNLQIRSEQKNQKAISLHRFTNSFLNKEVELSCDESFSKSTNKSIIGPHLDSNQFNKIINEKKKAFNDKIPKTYRQEVSRSPENKPLISERSFYCKNCKENEENYRKISSVLSQIIQEVSELNEIEALWRNGNFSFENERIGQEILLFLLKKLL